MTIHIQNKQQWNEAFIQGCQTGNLEEVRHLCQKQYLDAGFADIHLYEDYGFHLACKSGYFKIVKYLLASTELIASGIRSLIFMPGIMKGFVWLVPVVI